MISEEKLLRSSSGGKRVTSTGTGNIPKIFLHGYVFLTCALKKGGSRRKAEEVDKKTQASQRSSPLFA